MSTVKTNKSDYKPGSKVLITASDFSSDATIQFEVLNLGDDGVQGTADDFSYNAWSVTDGLRGDSDSAAGTVGTTWIVPGTALNSTLVLSAREAGSDGVFGTADDVVATTTFTDAPPASSVSVRLDQWADGPAPDADGTGQADEVFVNGNLNQTKAHYNEGDSVPYRALLDDLSTGVTYGLEIQWDTVDSGAYAIDYLTSFNFSFEGARHPGEPDVTPTAGINDVSSGAVSTVDIPSDDQLLTGFGAQFGITDGLSSGLPSGQQVFTLFGAVSNLSTSAITYNADLTKASITVNFLYTGGTANNADSVVVAWGGHIASALDWSDDPGETVQTASDISGSPYHTRVLSLFENGVETSIGNQDRSLSAAAVIAPPVAGDVSLLADEDNITGGNNDVQTGDDNQSGLTGTLPVTEATSVNFADLHLDPVLDTSSVAVKSGGTALTFFWDGASSTLYASTNTGSLAQAQTTAAFKIQVTTTSPFNYTFTLLDQVDHPDPGDTNTEDPNILIDLTYTALGGGGSDTGIVHVTIDDDIPITSATQLTGTVDEDGVPGGIADGSGDVAGEVVTATGNVSALFNSGADQPLTFSLNTVTSGLPSLTSGGVAVTYAVAGNVLTASAGPNTVFTFTLNGTTGAYTFELVDQLDHPTLNGVAGDDTENDLTIDLSSILQATDFDSDTVTAAANALVITVDDDTPESLTPAGLTVGNQAGATNSAALGAFGNVGADLPGTAKFVGTDGTVLQGAIQDGTPTLENLKSGGSNIFLFGFGTDTLIGTTDSTNTDASQKVFVMTLNPDGSVQANDLYDITMIRPIDNLVDVAFGSFISHVASGHTSIVNDIGSDPNIPGSGSTIDARFSGFVDKSDGTTTAVDPQVSQAGVGVGQGQDFNFDPQTSSTTDNLTDRMRIDFFEDDGDNVLEPGEEVTVNRFTFIMNQNNDPGDDGDALIRVYDEAGNEVQITGILVNGQVLVGTSGAPVPSNDPNPGGNVTAVANGLGYELHGLGGGTGGQDGDNDTVQIRTASGYSRIDISGIGNDAPKDTFDILLFSVAVPTPFDITFKTQADLTDADGDTTAPPPADLNVTLDADGIFSAAVTTVGTNPIDHALSA